MLWQSLLFLIPFIHSFTSTTKFGLAVVSDIGPVIIVPLVYLLYAMNLQTPSPSKSTNCDCHSGCSSNEIFGNGTGLQSISGPAGLLILELDSLPLSFIVLYYGIIIHKWNGINRYPLLLPLPDRKLRSECLYLL
jgi:hypothetical protein